METNLQRRQSLLVACANTRSSTDDQMQTNTIETTNYKEIWVWNLIERPISDSIPRILSLLLTVADANISLQSSSS